MGNFFPRWTNWLPLKIAVAAVFLLGGVTVGLTYYFTPKYVKVGYEPTQPVPFSHKQHVGEVGLDCRYCHSFVEVSGPANVPTNQTCYNCHGPDKGQIKKESEKLAMVRDADKNGTPIPWTKVHKAPDFVYFNHSVHLNRGISCVNCHSRIDKMEVVQHAEPHSMGWCLDCHRNPENKLRPLDQVTNLTYQPADLTRDAFYGSLAARGVKVESMARVVANDKKTAPLPDDLKGLVALATKTFGEKVTQTEVGAQLKEHWRIAPPESCAACHR